MKITSLKTNRLSPALLAILAAVCVAIVFAAGTGQGPASSGVAVASAPMSNSLVQSAADSGIVPLDLNFSDPQRVLDGSGYNNRSFIAASPQSGAVTLAWTNTPGDGTASVVECSNTAVGAPVTICHGLDRNHANQNEVIGEAADQLGRRHIVLWTYVGSAVCERYIIIGTDGTVQANEEIPGTCTTSPLRKLGALTIDHSNNAYIVLGKSSVTNSMGFWERAADGTYPVTNEPVSNAGSPTDWSIAVSTQGVVMIAFKAAGIYGSGSDVYTAVRQSPSNWTVEDISANCCDVCPGASGAYLPHLAADYQGNIHAVWADGRCPNYYPNDIYYREWVPGTGWDNQPLVRVVQNSGDSYYPDLTVDPTGEVYVTWSDETSSPVGYYRIFYSQGSGTVFSHVQIPFQDWSGNAWQKESHITYGGGYVHTSFSSIKYNPQKDNFYSYSLPKVVVTPTPVPPRCTDTQFRDVCHGDTFYQYITDLVNAGVINGYNSSPPCLNGLWVPCFLPNNNTSRGQMAKIVVLSANVPIDLTGFPHFQDVTSTNVFSTYIETAYNDGIINGYPCGGVGQPCVPPDNLPYYRPNNTVTRGQLTKMASIAFDLNAVPVGQTFQDVPPGSTFYTYTESIADLGIINGYPCGGVGQPCVPPDNLPYFRPNNPVTRGQSAKILDLFRMLPTPTPIPTATDTDTPTPTVTGTPPTDTPTVTGTPPTDTPVPTFTDTAVPTVSVTETALPGDTSTPTVTTTATTEALPTETGTPALR